MFCPECRGEYRKGIEECPTCEVRLVEEERARAPADPGEGMAAVLVDLVGYIDEHEAKDARRRLRAEKVPAEMVIRDAPGTERSETITEEYWIRVGVEHIARAHTILDVDRAVGEEPCPHCGEPADSSPACRRCGAPREE